MVVFVFLDVTMAAKLMVLTWKVVFFCISREQWKKEWPNVGLLTLASVLGLVVYTRAQYELMGPGLLPVLSMVLGGAVLCASLFAMNLGHYYLNVHGLSLSHLQRAVKVFLLCLTARLIWDLFLLFTLKIDFQGDIIPLYTFISTIEGFLLIIALFFGTLFPLGSLYFVNGTLRVKNTQSATGILYAILCSVLIGDITYKYYLLKWGLPL